MAARVPITVEITAASNVICNVVAKAVMIVSLLKQFLYHRRVKPPHVTLEVELLKLKNISTAIGRYKKINSKGGSLCVVDIDERINRVFELSGLYKIIKQYKNIDEALKVI